MRSHRYRCASRRCWYHLPFRRELPRYGHQIARHCHFQRPQCDFYRKQTDPQRLHRTGYGSRHCSRSTGVYFAEDISRDDIAAYACVTPNYLSTLFHAETGKTIREYISDCRLNESKRLLAATRKSISAIAMECGFGNISYFSTVFRKCVGKSPVEWRKEQKRT